jgi:hypothetical protein
MCRSRSGTPATLEDHACPHTVRFKESTGRMAEAMGQLFVGSGEGQSIHKRGLGAYVDRSERRCPIKQSGYQAISGTRLE